ncbi:DNA repair protein RecN [Flavobacteriales bacterium]|nr:DNA repair protein RecN [Flavobacteriales bacterium]
MISSLHIKNYALIKELDIHFSDGFTSITGETGAGKSIFVGALSLILGERSGSSLLINPKEKCIVEGEFEISKYNLNSFFDKNELDFNNVTVLRREISPNGRSRSFINDTPVNLAQMKELGVQLFDIHSQNQSHQINKKSYQLQILDAYSKNSKLLEEYKVLFSLFLSKKKNLEELQNKALSSQTDHNYKQFLLEELDKAEISDAEELNLIEQELKVLSNSEDISAKISTSINLAENSENSIIDQLQNLNNNLQSISQHSDKIDVVYNRINSILLELKDSVLDLHSLSENIVFDPQRLSILKNRYDLLNNLMNKHSFVHLNGLIEFKNNLEVELNSVVNLQDEIDKAKDDLEKIEKEVVSKANKLTLKRIESVSMVEGKVKDLLSKLGMENAVLKIELNKLDAPNENGLDDINLMFSANKGIELAELTKVASGGEMSRLMFSIKSCIANNMSLPTILFDEIDTGVSGEIAHKMGELMDQLAQKYKMQVISITHLPQVAARGKNQMFVEKKTIDNTSYTNIRTLQNDEREREIAKMLSGSEVTDVSLSNARELLSTK